MNQKIMRITRTAQKQNAQEQFIGKCDNCKTVNKITTYFNLEPKFCEKCGLMTTYHKSQLL